MNTVITHDVLFYKNLGFQTYVYSARLGDVPAHPATPVRVTLEELGEIAKRRIRPELRSEYDDESVTHVVSAHLDDRNVPLIEVAALEQACSDLGVRCRVILQGEDLKWPIQRRSN